MFISIFILILLLPAACLPLALDIFVSKTDLDEMGISLEGSDNTLPIQGYELVDEFPISNSCEQLQVC